MILFAKSLIFRLCVRGYCINRKRERLITEVVSKRTATLLMESLSFGTERDTARVTASGIRTAKTARKSIRYPLANYLPLMLYKRS